MTILTSKEKTYRIIYKADIYISSYYGKEKESEKKRGSLKEECR